MKLDDEADSVWCELRGRWCEELRMLLSRLLELLADDNPRWDGAKFACQAPRSPGGPSAWLRMLRA
eukprot:4544114-Pyramimonas_sp.AAC.1